MSAEPSSPEVEAAKRAVMNELESFAIPDDTDRDWDKFAEFVVDGVIEAVAQAHDAETLYERGYEVGYNDATADRLDRDKLADEIDSYTAECMEFRAYDLADRIIRKGNQVGAHDAELAALRAEVGRLREVISAHPDAEECANYPAGSPYNCYREPPVVAEVCLHCALASDPADKEGT